MTIATLAKPKVVLGHAKPRIAPPVPARSDWKAFAEKAGIDPARALDILSASAAGSWMLKNRGPRMVHDDGVVTSAVDIFVKDLDLVLGAGKAAKMGLPLAAAAHQQFVSASGLGHGVRDDSQVIRVYRTLAGKDGGKG